MTRSCTEYQKIILDIFYDERDMDEEIREHIENCSECKRYYQDLVQIKEKLDDAEHKVDVEYSNISMAFEKAEKITKLRNVLSMITFIILGSIILSTVIVMALKGYARHFIYIQIILYFLMPLSVPLLIKIRWAREGYNE